MKKKILALAVVAMFTSIIASGTLAYFTAEEKTHNVITSGGVDIELVEKTKGNDGVEVDFPSDGIHGVMPGTSVSKIVKVKNTGSGDAWIRVQITPSIKDAAGAELPLAIGEGNVPVMTCDIFDEHWIDGGDGYYYHKEAIQADEFTEVLFEEVDFNVAMGNEYQNSIANILIDAQAVQAANNGTDVMEAKGWPKNEEGGEL